MNEKHFQKILDFFKFKSNLAWKASKVGPKLKKIGQFLLKIANPKLEIGALKSAIQNILNNLNLFLQLGFLIFFIFHPKCWYNNNYFLHKFGPKKIGSNLCSLKFWSFFQICTTKTQLSQLIFCDSLCQTFGSIG